MAKITAGADGSVKVQYTPKEVETMAMNDAVRLGMVQASMRQAVRGKSLAAVLEAWASMSGTSDRQIANDLLAALVTQLEGLRPADEAVVPKSIAHVILRGLDRLPPVDMHGREVAKTWIVNHAEEGTFGE